MIIGERLKGYLKSHHISAKSFAEMVGVTEGMVYKYYKMDSIDSSTINKWANALSVPIMTFMDDEMYNRATRKMTAEDLALAEEYYNENKERIHFQNRRIFGDLAGAPRELVVEEFKKTEKQEPDSQVLRNIIKSQQQTIESMARTIESMQEQIKKMLVQAEDVATCANASGFELGK